MSSEDKQFIADYKFALKIALVAVPTLLLLGNLFIGLD